MLAAGHTKTSYCPRLVAKKGDSCLPAFSGIMKGIDMEPGEKQSLEMELKDSFYQLDGTNSNGVWVNEIRIEPEKLQKLLQHLIEAL